MRSWQCSRHVVVAVWGMDALYGSASMCDVHGNVPVLVRCMMSSWTERLVSCVRTEPGASLMTTSWACVYSGWLDPEAFGRELAALLVTVGVPIRAAPSCRQGGWGVAWLLIL